MNENYKKLKTAVKSGELDDKEFEQYTNVLKDALKKSLEDLCIKLKKNNFQRLIKKFLVSKSTEFNNLDITDTLLQNLLEHPTNAFEIVFDKHMNKKIIKLKNSFTKQGSTIKKYLILRII